MSSPIRCLVVVGFLFAGLTGCAASTEDSEPAAPPNEEQAEGQDDEASQAEVQESKLAIQKKMQINGRKESGLPKK
jgi:hypothetical protein